MRTLLSLLLVLAVPLGFAQESAPDALVKSITKDVISIIKQDKDIQSGDPIKLSSLVENKIVPYFDFTHMTQLAVAVNWPRATPQQHQQLVQEFKHLLVRTYSNALSLYRNQVIDFKPMRSRRQDAEVTVRCEIKQQGDQPVALDYDMEKTPAGWKVYDVKVDSVSLVTTYREDFAGQVRAGGIDGLIKSLSTKNRELDAKPRV